MKTNDLLNQLSQNISDSYDVVEAGGGAMPSDRITWNLANAIRTIPEPTPPVENKYGVITYYPDFTVSYSINSTTRCTASISDADKLLEFLHTNMYEEKGQVSFGYVISTGLWKGPDNEKTWDMNTFLQQSGLSVTINSGVTTTCVVTLDKNVTVDTTSRPVDMVLETIEDYQALCLSGGAPLSSYVNSIALPHDAIKKFTFGDDCGDTIGDYFLERCSNLEEIDTAKCVQTTIGNYFLAYSGYNGDFTFPSTLQSVGNYFFGYCDSFNHKVTINNGVALGTYFLAYCSVFNTPIDISKASSIGVNFMYNCVNFNSTVSLGTLESIPKNFMHSCSAFNCPLDTSNVKSIDAGFLNNCSSFNQDLDFRNVTSLTPNAILYRANNFCSVISVGNTLPTLATASATAKKQCFATTSNSASIYTTGVIFSGGSQNDWVATFPSNSTSPFRNTIAGLPPDFATITYYPATRTETVESETEGVTINSVDSAKLQQFLDSYPPDGLDGRFELRLNSWRWRYSGGKTLTISSSNFASTTGINITVDSQVTSAYILVNEESTIDPQGTPLQATFKGETSFTTFWSSQPKWMQVDGKRVYNRSVIEVTTVAPLTTIPDYFLLDCPYFNSRLDLSEVTQVGEKFLGDCTAFNQTISMPKVTTIGDEFLIRCTNFSRPIYFPSLTTVGRAFMQDCTSFNSTILLPKLESMGGDFLASCSSFNQPLNLSKVTSCPGLMHGCSSFNSSLTLGTITDVGNSFLAGCVLFNQYIDFSNVTLFGNSFLEGCTSFNQIVEVDSATNIGLDFMQSCSSFNQNITLPSTLTYVGMRFLYNCDSLVSTVTFECPIPTFGSFDGILATTNQSASCYTQGIKISGAYKSDWKTTLPDSDSSPYRKLILV